MTCHFPGCGSVLTSCCVWSLGFPSVPTSPFPTSSVSLCWTSSSQRQSQMLWQLQTTKDVQGSGSVFIATLTLLILPPSHYVLPPSPFRHCHPSTLCIATPPSQCRHCHLPTLNVLPLHPPNTGIATLKTQYSYSHLVTSLRTMAGVPVDHTQVCLEWWQTVVGRTEARFCHCMSH